MKKLSVFSVILLSGLLLVTACQNKGNSSIESESESESETVTEETSYPPEDVFHILKAHPNVVSIKSTYPGDIKDKYTQLYRLFYKQLIDHNDPSKGTFNQKVEIGYRAYDAPTVLVTEGYSFDDNQTAYSMYGPQNELAHLLNGNYVYVEHRYFGDSKISEDFDYTQSEGWEYLTTAQAAADLHSIVTDLRPVLQGKWLSSGASKGGMTTEMYAYYYPHDIEVYVPRVAPFANSFSDTRFYDFVYTEAGNVTYGEEKAKEYRDITTDFVIKLLEYRDDFAPKAYKAATKAGCQFVDGFNQDVLYDISVMEFPIGEWQYYHNFSSLKKCLDMPDTDLEAKKNAFYSIYSSMSPISDLEFGGIYQPYFVQAYRELGDYGYNVSYLKAAIEEKGSSATLTLSDEEFINAYEQVTMSQEMRDNLPRMELMGPKITKFLKETDCNMILIYGASDPWYSIRPEDPVDNPHVRIYVNEKLTHDAAVSNFGTVVKKEILDYIHSIID